MRSFDEIEIVKGRQFALEIVLTHLVWQWGRQQGHPPSALSEFFRPLDQGLKSQSATEHPPSVAITAALGLLGDMQEEIQRMLHTEAVVRTNRPTGREN